ncbi:probable rhamnogalacturonate lyase B isoform X5 [Magnolia sinica]|uniref:probable rhamnogalacturonate lyase B isoform X5 n=1 Tax=Magnolia sinica TaxID=86752 RepID=UPI002659A9F1|nr:probable rhamnogalacturonate lyase B isoform X5 [Magnolia sinica]
MFSCFRCASKQKRKGKTERIIPDSRLTSRPDRNIGSCSRPMSALGVHLQIQDKYVVIDNGILRVTLSKPDGIVTGIRYNGVDNLLEVRNKEVNRGYWDVYWSEPGGPGIFDVIKGTSFKVIREDENQVEVSFTRTWDPSLKGVLIPLNIDKRFHYMAISDDRQRIMPMPDDRESPQGQPLAYIEPVHLINPIHPDLRGEVDDKYQYSCENKDIKVHGWICFDPPVGFWNITPSDEFRTGGPLKQNLTSHVGPTTLSVFLSGHYSGEDLVPKFTNGEPWKKVFGLVFMYVNSGPAGTDPLSLWEDAKLQTAFEVESWPYNFPVSEDFPNSDQRGSISGRLLVIDRYGFSSFVTISMDQNKFMFLSEDYISADSAYVGLALPGAVGSWQRECKGYQFWTRADSDGFFSINHIRTGDYNLYAWVPGFIGDYRNDEIITITEGCDIVLGDLVYEPPRDGPTLWEIGIPDRSAAEFYVPDPNPMYVNKLYINHPDKFRQYGLWERYADLYPNNDLVYTVGVSDYRKDWFYAQVTRKKDDKSYQATTWQIKFTLDTVAQSGTYKLRLAIASATLSELQVRFNDPKANRPHFTTGLFGRDNSIARHGIHGLYWLFNVNIPSCLLVGGGNTIFLTQPRSASPFQGILYDYIRLEGPADPDSNKEKSSRILY